LSLVSLFVRVYVPFPMVRHSASAVMSLIFMASAGPILDEHVARGLFSEFKSNFSRRYTTRAEEDTRFQIFFAKLKWINEENSKGEGAVMVVNQFSDLSKDEFLSMYANLRQPDVGGAWGDDGFLGYHESGDVDLLGDVDWVSKGAVTPVKNQGQCGSCWSFSVTGTLEGRYQIASGRLVSLSEQQFVDCDRQNHGCNGGFPAETLSWAKGRPICKEDSYPYTARDGSCRASGCSPGIPAGEITGYRKVPSGSSSGLATALNSGPVSVLVDASGAFHSYGGGVLTNRCGTSLNHAVLAVGYTSRYWKVKNSWGTRWGEAGYIRMTRNGNECGILDGPSYPVMAGSPGPGPAPPPGPGPSPGPTPCVQCRYNSGCPGVQRCYYMSRYASSGCCLSHPPYEMEEPAVVV